MNENIDWLDLLMNKGGDGLNIVWLSFSSVVMKDADTLTNEAEELINTYQKDK